jgi:ATP-dependent Clp protease ATP-binding subunit ClpB
MVSPELARTCVSPELVDRMAVRLKDRKFTVELTNEAKSFLVEAGYEPAFGARPLKRAIRRFIEDQLAMEILEGNFNEGDHILIDRGVGKNLVFRKK